LITESSKKFREYIRNRDFKRANHYTTTRTAGG